MPELRLFITLSILLIILIKGSGPIKKKKKKKSGNGTSAKQDLYILVNVPYVWVAKVGISGNAAKRKKEIDKSAKGKDLVLVKFRIHYAYQVEQFIHRLCAPIRVRFDGSGKTERFFILAIIPAFIFGLLFWLVERLFWLGVLVGVVIFLRVIISS